MAIDSTSARRNRTRLPRYTGSSAPFLINLSTMGTDTPNKAALCFLLIRIAIMAVLI